MTEAAAVHQTITGSLEVATRFLNHFLPAGEIFPGNGSGDGVEAFFKIGDFHNTPAKEKGPQGGSVYLKLPELCGRDKTTDEKVNGPIPILRILHGCDAGSAVEIAQEWLQSEGIEFEGAGPSRGRPKAEPYPWSQAVANCSNAACLNDLESFRGFAPELGRRILSLELLAFIGGHWCFPIHNKNEVVVGINQLIKHPFYQPDAARQQWVPKPLGIDRSVWMRIGASLSVATLIVICESSWDALAVLSLYSDEDLKSVTILSTHGTGGSVLPRFEANVKRVIVAVQNDEPSRRWGEKLAQQAAGYEFAVVLPPDPIKDFNDLLRKGLLLRADFDEAKACSVDPLTGAIRIDLRPWYTMFSDYTESGPALEEGARLMAASDCLFEVGNTSSLVRGELTWLRPGFPAICLGRPGADQVELDFNLPFQSIARTRTWRNERGKRVLAPAALSGAAARLLLSGWSQARTGLELKTVDHILANPCLLQDESGGLIVPGPGYHQTRGGAVFVQSEGPKIPPMEFAEAVEVLAGLVSEYESAYAEKSDRSRYYALLLGPEMQSAGFVTGEYPLGFFDAADINHGKSSAAMRICLFYGERPAMVMPVSGQGGGVARFESLLSAALLEMKRFNFIDNWRGHINSSLLNTLLTELIAQLRASYDRERQISAAGRIFLLSSNSAEPGPDLFSRSLPVRLKSPAVWIMPKSDREAQIRAEFPRLTAARRAIIRRWHAQDCPKGNDKRHRFTGFFGPMCGLIEGTLGMSPILDGVESEARWRQEPVLVWLRQLADFYREKDPGRLRGAKDLFDDCRAHNMTPPGFVKGRESIQLRKDIGLALRAAAERRTEADLGLYTAFLVHQATTARAGSNYASGRWQVRFVLK